MYEKCTNSAVSPRAQLPTPNLQKAVVDGHGFKFSCRDFFANIDGQVCALHFAVAGRRRSRAEQSSRLLTGARRVHQFCFNYLNSSSSTTIIMNENLSYNII